MGTEAGIKVLQLSTSDRSGGAALACMRLAEALQSNGHSVRMLVQEKRSHADWVQTASASHASVSKYLKHVEYAFAQRYKVREGYQFASEPWIAHPIARHPWLQWADVINIHWVQHGFLSIREWAQIGALGKPVIWHLHDFRPFTGGCHYPGACQNYLHACGQCPALRKASANDESARQWKQQAAIFQRYPMVMAGASAWITREAQRSGLGAWVRAVHMPNPIDTLQYSPGARADSRTALGLPMDVPLLLFASINAADERKGFRQLIEALNHLRRQKPQAELIVIGKSKPEWGQSLPCRAHLLGSLSPDRMIDAYRAADVFVLPSLEDNLPNTVLESMACGTPVAAFRIGGISEMVQDPENGALAQAGDGADLARAIETVLNHPNPTELAMHAREWVSTQYHPDRVVRLYTQLMQELLNNSTESDNAVEHRP
ncbi:MAG: glycosyltransferase [Bacteroidetes bacterium]|nr:glycosyltransferase [Bacteroidota bacterium]